MAKMTDEVLRAAVSAEIHDATGYDSEELSHNRQQALRAYFGRADGTEVTGRSTVISKDVADSVNSIGAEFAGQWKSTLVEFEASSEQDEDAATLESDFVTWIANQSNIYTQFSDGAFDALLMANSWIKVYVDEDMKTWETEHKDLTDVGVAMAMEVTSPHEVITIKSQRDTEEGLINLKLTHTVKERRLRVKTIPPEYMLFNAGGLSMNMDDHRFICEKKLITRSDLIEMGFDKALVKGLPSVDFETWIGAAERSFGFDDRRSGHHVSNETIDVFECYYRVDFDGDGIAELRRVMTAGFQASILLLNEPAQFIPYACGSALPLPHRLTGTSQYDLMMPIQRAKTSVLRQLLDNQNVANNSRVGAVEGEVNLQDLASSRPGGIIRMRTAGAITPIPFNDVGGSCIQTLSYLDRVRTMRGGSALEMQTGEMDIAKTSATAAAGEYANKEKMAAFYCRNLVETMVRDTYLLIHQALRYFYDEDITAKLRGKWQTTNPKTWPARYSIRVIAGLSSTERREKLQLLSQNLSHQTQAMQAGLDGELVSADKIYESLADWLRAADLAPVESYFVDPQSEEAKQARQGKQQAAQAESQKMEILQQRLVDNEQALDKYKHDSQLEFDRLEALLNAEVEEAKIIGKITSEAEAAKLKLAASGGDDAA